MCRAGGGIQLVVEVKLLAYPPDPFSFFRWAVRKACTAIFRPPGF